MSNIFRKHCYELEELGFEVGSSGNPVGNTAFIFLQKQLVGRMNQNSDNTIMLKFDIEEFNYRDYTPIVSDSFMFWWINMPTSKTKPYVSEDKKPFKDIARLSKRLASYSRKLKKTDEFAQLTFREQNAYILPFFFAGYKPEVCSAMLPYNIPAHNTLVKLLMQRNITFTDVHLFKDLPEETLEAFATMTEN